MHIEKADNYIYNMAQFNYSNKLADTIKDALDAKQLTVDQLENIARDVIDPTDPDLTYYQAASVGYELGKLGTPVYAVELDNQIFFFSGTEEQIEDKILDRDSKATADRVSWDEFISYLETVHSVDAIEKLTDFVAEVYNGGIEQYIEMDLVKNLSEIQSLLRRINKPYCQKLLALLKELDPNPKDVRMEEIDDLETKPSYKKFEDWIYKNANAEELFSEVVNYIKKTEISKN